MQYIIMLATMLLVGCATAPTFPTYVDSTIVPHYDVPPHTLYRIDDNRYLSLENYNQYCFGDNYYIDKRQNIKTDLGRGGIVNYSGRLIIDDPTGMNVVIPTAPGGACGDRNCNAALLYSTDGGKTFHGTVYMNSHNPPKASEDYTIAVTKDAFYVAKKISATNGSIVVARYPLVPGFVYGSSQKLPGENHIEFDAKMPANLRTPSGQENFSSCDATTPPTNIPNLVK